jgi:hypothetical protein
MCEILGFGGDHTTSACDYALAQEDLSWKTVQPVDFSFYSRQFVRAAELLQKETGDPPPPGVVRTGTLV